MRPYVICHMTTSIDGKVTGDFLYTPHAQSAVETYYEINRRYQGDAYACGRITMEGSFTGGWYPDLSQYAAAHIDRTDYAADASARYFAVAFDRRGRLGWKASRIYDEDPGYDNAHIIEVLCEDVSDAYLAYLRETGISYIFAGAHEMDVSLALEKLYSLFGIKKLLLEGGSVINGAFQQAGLIDELSLVVAPLTAQQDALPLFAQNSMCCFALKQTQIFKDNVLWLNYVRRNIN